MQCGTPVGNNSSDAWARLYNANLMREAYEDGGTFLATGDMPAVTYPPLRETLMVWQL